MTTIIRTVAEMWPEHAGHDVRYSEFGRTDYRLIDVEMDRLDAVDPGDPPEFVLRASTYDAAPIDARLDETSMWCADCGHQLSDYWQEE
jgi:hypothetical protein